MPAGGSIYVVSHVGKDLQVPAKVASILGEYIQTEPTCYRKEVSGKPVGGKLEFKDGYWYLVDKVGTKVAWVEGKFDNVPTDTWQTSGESYVFSRSADAQLSVKPKTSVTAASGSKEIGCSEYCSKKFHETKAKLPDHHRKKVEDLQAKANQHIDSMKAKADEHLPVLKEQANKHLETAKQKYNDVAPVVKQKTKEGYNACYDFWTHPDTVAAMRIGAQKTGEGLMYVGATCLSFVATGLDLIAGSHRAQAQQEEEGDFVKLESTGVVPEPSR